MIKVTAMDGAWSIEEFQELKEKYDAVSREKLNLEIENENLKKLLEDKFDNNETRKKLKELEALHITAAVSTCIRDNGDAQCIFSYHLGKDGIEKATRANQSVYVQLMSTLKNVRHIVSTVYCLPIIADIRDDENLQIMGNWTKIEKLPVVNP